jgi:hypothetical protein
MQKERAQIVKTFSSLKRKMRTGLQIDLPLWIRTCVGGSV